MARCSSIHSNVYIRFELYASIEFVTEMQTILVASILTEHIQMTTPQSGSMGALILLSLLVAVPLLSMLFLSLSLQVCVNSIFKAQINYLLFSHVGKCLCSFIVRSFLKFNFRKILEFQVTRMCVFFISFWDWTCVHCKYFNHRHIHNSFFVSFACISASFVPFFRCLPE